jgi:hypothetical protein
VPLALSTAETGICEDPLQLDPFCSYLDLSLPNGWTVTNLNDFAVEFTWVYATENSVAPISLAAGATYTFYTVNIPGATMQVFVDGILMASAAAEICPAFLTLQLDGICAADPEELNAWIATNPNPFAVSAEWRLNGTTLAGLLTIPAGSSVVFTTDILATADIMMLYYGGIFQDDASAAVSCLPPVNPPEPPPGAGGGGEPAPLIIPVTGGDAPVLIPVTGVSDDLRGLRSAGMFSLSLVFFGLGTVLHGIYRRREQK